VKKRPRKNPHAVALGRLGGLVCSEAKKRANQENGRKGGLVKSRKKTIGSQTQRATAKARAPQERVSAAISSIRARFGKYAIGFGDLGIRYGRARAESII
jgi:hypothetical protein